jgi:hypothetical protein
VIYRHEQIGRAYFVVLAFAAVVFLGLAFVTQYAGISYAMCALLVLTCIAFARLTIEVDSNRLRWGMTFAFPEVRFRSKRSSPPRSFPSTSGWASAFT